MERLVAAPQPCRASSSLAPSQPHRIAVPARARGRRARTTPVSTLQPAFRGRMTTTAGWARPSSSGGTFATIAIPRTPPPRPPAHRAPIATHRATQRRPPAGPHSAARPPMAATKRRTPQTRTAHTAGRWAPYLTVQGRRGCDDVMWHVDARARDMRASRAEGTEGDVDAIATSRWASSSPRPGQRRGFEADDPFVTGRWAQIGLSDSVRLR